MSSCRHHWSPCNLRHGWLVVEGCFECGARSSFFSTETYPPIDEYREGKHFWATLGTYQSSKFDLECRDCRQRVDLDDVNGLMLSECQDPDCRVGRMVAAQAPGHMVFVALCEDSMHRKGRCVSVRGIKALSEYFNRDIEALGRRVVVVPCRMCSSVDRCMGTILADIGMTDF